MNNKKIAFILIVLAMVFTIIGSTFAYWNWQSTNAQKTLVTFTVTPGMTCSADGGGNITNTVALAPSTCDNTNYAIQRPITVSTTTQTANEIINLDLYLHVDSIAQELLDSDNFKYAITTNSNYCDGAINTGSFGNDIDSQTNNITLLSNEEFVGSETKIYYLYIWLDEAETNPNTMNKSFSLSLDGSCSDSGNVMNKVYAYFGGSSSYFKEAAYRDNITSVSFVNSINIPDNATNWSVGIAPSNADDVKAWLEDDGNGKNILKIGANETIFATNLAFAFSYLTNANNFDFSYLNTSETVNMAHMFRNVGCNASNLHLVFDDTFVTSNVTTMVNMFRAVGMNSDTVSLNLGNHFDTSKVSNMDNMFSQVGQYSNNWSLNLGDHFDTSNVNNMANMFGTIARNNTTWSLNLGNNFNTSKVINMARMFSYMAEKSNSVSLSLGNHFDTSNVNNMSSMFANFGYSAANMALNLGNKFNTSNVICMYSMFSSTFMNTEILNINLGDKFDTSNVTNMGWMFSNVGQNSTNFNLNLGNKFNTSKVTDMTSMFYHVGMNSTNFSLNLGNKFNTINANNMAEIFSHAGQQAAIWNLNLGDKFDTSNVTNMQSFLNLAAYDTTIFNLSLGNKFNTSKVTDMCSMFWGIGRNATFFNLNLGNQFDMSNVEKTQFMFYNAAQKAANPFVLDLSAGNLSSVTNNFNMFVGFGTNNATIYVKDATAQSFIIAQNSNFSASNVLIK